MVFVYVDIPLHHAVNPACGFFVALVSMPSDRLPDATFFNLKQ